MDKKNKGFDALGEAKRLLQGFIESNLTRNSPSKNAQPVPMTEEVTQALNMKSKIDKFLNYGLFISLSVFLILLYCAIYN